MPAQRRSIPHSRLVPHDIRLTRVQNSQGREEVVATIECERRACTLRVETCARCERFARVEPHEAGYTMLCRSTDSYVPPESSEQDPEEDPYQIQILEELVAGDDRQALKRVHGTQIAPASGMSEANHDLIHEFPEYRERIHELKQNDGHFVRLAGQYHELSKQLHRINAQLETPSDDAVEQLKLERVRLKDELYGMLKT